MSEWLSCEVENLYLHSVCRTRVFVYTDCGQPESAADAFQKERFALVVSQEDQSGLLALRSLAEQILKSRRKKQIILYRQGERQELGLEQEEGEACLRLTAGAFLPLENYGLELGAHAGVTPGRDEGGEYLALSGSCGFYCQGRGCFFQRELRIQLEGALAGCFQLRLTGIKSLTELGTFLCFTRERERPIRGRWIDAVRFQPLEPLERPFDLNAVIDVLRPEDGKRTYFELPEGVYESGFAAAFGENPRLCLERSGDAVLVFSGERLYRENRFCHYNLSPRGRFMIEGEGGDLLPGGNGMEYLRYKGGDSIYFRSGQPAHFPLRTEKTDWAGAEKTAGVTSYLSTDGLYYSQGQDAGFFAGGAEGSMEFAEIPLAALSKACCLPVLPMGVSDGFLREGEALAGAFDGELLAGERNRAAGRAAVSKGAAEPLITAISEKGLVVSYAVGEDCFRSVEIADRFRFQNLRGALRRSLLAPQPFLVLCGKDPAAGFADYVAEEHPLTVGGWSFDFSPKNWSDDTLFILKYTSGRSAADLCGDPGAWSWPLSIGEIEKAQKALREVLKDESIAGSQPELNELSKILRDPQWCGAVLIHMPLTSACLPAEIAFLVSAGMPVQFDLNYMIFERRTVSREGLLLPTPVSGLVFYQDDSYKAPDAQYEFLYRLNEVRAVIKNSMLADFHCELSIAFNYMLASPLRAVDSPTGNYIPISGGLNRLPEAEGVSRYFFKLKNPVEYQAEGSAIRRMSVTGASLAASDEGGLMFSFSGEFVFVRYDRDLFSFSEGDPAGACRLKFSGYQVRAWANSYVKSTERLMFHMGESIPRPDSLAACFSLSFESMLTSRIPPEQMGFEGIYVEGISQKELKGSWAGMICRVDLGGLGALAGAVKTELTLLLAWSPGTVEKNYDGSIRTGLPDLYVGIRFGEQPGGAAEFALEGVLSLGFEAVELKWDSKGENFYFVLRDFAVKVLKLRFPDGSSRILLFGNKSDPDKPAWYGAYEREGKEGKL